MSEEQAGESRSWLERLGLFLTGDPEDRVDLLVFLRGTQKRHVIDPEALSMI